MTTKSIVSYELVAFAMGDATEIRAPLLRASSHKLEVVEMLARWVARNKAAFRMELREIVVEHAEGGYERPRRTDLASMRLSADAWIISIKAPGFLPRPWEIEAAGHPILGIVLRRSR